MGDVDHAGNTSIYTYSYGSSPNTMYPRYYSYIVTKSGEAVSYDDSYVYFSYGKLFKYL